MAKVTSKLQVTIPKALAEQYRIEPGDEITWEPAGQAIRVVPAGLRQLRGDVQDRLRRFDQATERQRQREAERPAAAPASGGRGWTREELYQRGGPG